MWYVLMVVYLLQDLESFISEGGDSGFIYFSMGSSVKAANMPEYLRRMLMRVFRQLPQRVLWKYEADDEMPDLPSNVKLGRWLPQQDILGNTVTIFIFTLSPILNSTQKFKKNTFVYLTFYTDDG